jgi:hypothetical protein
MTPDFRALVAEGARLLDAATDHDDLAIRADHWVTNARAALAEQPVEPTDEESDAFAIVQMRLDDLAGDQELMIYRWPKAGDWDIQHTNPSSSVQLGEVNGKYSCAGTTLEEAVRKLANALPVPSLKEQALNGLEKVESFTLGQLSGVSVFDEYKTHVDNIRRALEALPE